MILWNQTAKPGEETPILFNKKPTSPNSNPTVDGETSTNVSKRPTTTNPIAPVELFKDQ